MAEWNSTRMACLSDVVCMSLTASETDGCAGHCKNKQYKVPQIHYTHLSCIQGSVAHRPFADSVAALGTLIGPHFRLASALTVGYYTSLCSPQSP